MLLLQPFLLDGFGMETIVVEVRQRTCIASVSPCCSCKFVRIMSALAHNCSSRVPAPEAIVRTPQQRRWYILKQDVARYGPTPGCEACVALAGGAQRVTKSHSDECRARMDELMQRDEDAVVQRLHADRLRRGSTVVGSSGDERRNPDVEMSDQACRQGVAEMHPESEAHKRPREREQMRQGSSTDAPRAGGAEEPMGTAAEDPDVRRGMKRSAT